ncbi:30S ribosome-binding factor RbfA [Patescibacteria group bacterium]
MAEERMVRINELIKRQLSLIFVRELDLPHESFVTVTDVKTTKDLSECTVFVGITPDDSSEEILDYLERRSKVFHRELNGKIRLRKIPKISFKLDETEKKATHIEQILDDIAQNGDMGNKNGDS